MYKLTIIVAIAFVAMAFAQPGKNQGKKENSNKNNGAISVTTEGKGSKDNKNHSPNNPMLAQSKHGGKNDKGGSKNHGGSNKQGKQGGNVKMKQHNPFGGSPSKGHNNKAGKSHKQNQSDFGKPSKGNHGYPSYSKGKKGKDGKMYYDKGHPNFGYVYISNHGYYSHKNYGQWRSKQAKNKHKNYHPYYEYEAVEGFNLIITRNSFLYTETDYKINLINQHLARKRKANLITVVQYNTHRRRIAVLQQRRAALQINIEL